MIARTEDATKAHDQKPTATTSGRAATAARKTDVKPAKVRTAVKASPARTASTTEKAANAAVKPATKTKTAPAKLKDTDPKPAKVKLVRDSFTMPSDEYAVLAVIKQRALAKAHPVKKSELLRAGVKLLEGLSDAALLRTLKGVPTIKTGRPKTKKGD
ncbi:hypothetical protein PEC18_31360 [Paucibacter sp. O1-1]|nr:hypothetical protein [Paucibacter sp. O1-1]MDA3830203.1 hypothetical protein [Paucibacter sp. O1-1]